MQDSVSGLSRFFDIEAAPGDIISGEWGFPELEAGSMDRCPLVILLPSVSGEHQRAGLHDLAIALQSSGRATITFRKTRGHSWNIEDFLKVYTMALGDPRVRRDEVVLIGFAESADWIAKYYYQFYFVHWPRAAILISSHANAFHLNNLTCPYLLLHGVWDPVLQIHLKKEFDTAIWHHQMRYSDPSKHVVFPELGRALGQKELAPEVIEEITDWLDQVPVAPARSLFRKPRFKPAA